MSPRKRGIERSWSRLPHVHWISRLISRRVGMAAAATTAGRCQCGGSVRVQLQRDLGVFGQFRQRRLGRRAAAPAAGRPPPARRRTAAVQLRVQAQQRPADAAPGAAERRLRRLVQHRLDREFGVQLIDLQRQLRQFDLVKFGGRGGGRRRGSGPARACQRRPSRRAPSPSSWRRRPAPGHPCVSELHLERQFYEFHEQRLIGQQLQQRLNLDDGGRLRLTRFAASAASPSSSFKA